MLHSFWLQAGLDAFAEVARTDPGCAMAHWGSAMMWWGNPLAGPVSAKGLTEGWAAVERAKAVGARTPREAGYIAAVEAFYKDADKVDHRTRALAYEKAMESLTRQYPADTEAAVFYALALNVTLDSHRQDLRQPAQGRGHPGAHLRQAAGPSRRGPLPDPQL
jgi:hypothetical protein